MMNVNHSNKGLNVWRANARTRRVAFALDDDRSAFSIAAGDIRRQVTGLTNQSDIAVVEIMKKIGDRGLKFPWCENEQFAQCPHAHSEPRAIAIHRVNADRDCQCTQRDDAQMVCRDRGEKVCSKRDESDGKDEGRREKNSSGTDERKTDPPIEDAYQKITPPAPGGRNRRRKCHFRCDGWLDKIILDLQSNANRECQADLRRGCGCTADAR